VLIKNRAPFEHEISAASAFHKSKYKRRAIEGWLKINHKTEGKIKTSKQTVLSSTLL
jgi:hypothetical protein